MCCHVRFIVKTPNIQFMLDPSWRPLRFSLIENALYCCSSWMKIIPFCYKNECFDRGLSSFMRPTSGLSTIFLFLVVANKQEFLDFLVLWWNFYFYDRQDWIFFCQLATSPNKDELHPCLYLARSPLHSRCRLPRELKIASLLPKYTKYVSHWILWFAPSFFDEVVDRPG